MENPSNQTSLGYINPHINSLSGLFPTVTSVPTHIPRKFDEQFRIYQSGSAYRFYWYDTTNAVWKYTSLPVTESEITLADVTTNDVSTTKHGFVPKAPNDTTKFLRGDATWAVPSGGGEVQAVCVPGMGTVSGATVTQEDGGELASVRFDDGQNNDEWNCTFVVPKGANNTTISSIKIFYKNKAASSLNIYGFFKVYHYDNTANDTRTDDTTATATAFASPSTSGQLGVITAPADAYNAIGTVTEGDLVFVTFNRQGADALDTYGQALYALAMVVTFA